MTTKTPEQAIEELRAAEQALLESYGWTKKETPLRGGGVRIGWIDPRNGDHHDTMWSAITVLKTRINY